MLQKPWRFTKFTNDSYLVHLLSVEFCFSHFFFAYLFSFRVLFCFFAVIRLYEEFKIWFSLFCRVLLLALFFFVPVFISCLFRGDEWHNYFTSVIGLYNRLLSKMGPFWTSGEFSITYSLKFGFSLFCWVLHLAYFFLPVFTSCSFVFFVFFSRVIYNWEAFGYSHWPTANIIKKAYNATE